MATPNVQLWHSLLVLAVLAGAVIQRAASALSARAKAERVATAPESTPTRRLAA